LAGFKLNFFCGAPYIPHNVRRPYYEPPRANPLHFLNNYILCLAASWLFYIGLWKAVEVIFVTVSTLGSGNDNAVAQSYQQDLQTQEENIVPSYIEQSRSYTVEVDEADRQDSKEDDEFSDISSVLSGENSYSSYSDACFDEDVCISIMSQISVIPLIARPPQVLEHVTTSHYYLDCQ